ncbi:MAG: repeat-containing protein [Flavipsychrobacter sp.]|jgi:TolA-binding protein|nr:repeat-containing protein [Flavipsychrobacter sp.]
MIRQQLAPILRGVFTAVIIFSGVVNYAQVLSPDLPENRNLLLFEEQYKQGHYSVAAQTAREYLKQSSHKVYAENAGDVDKAKYYLSLASLKANLPGGKDSAIAHMNATANPAYKQRIGFALAQYYFRSGEQSKAIPLYESSGNGGNLDEKEQVDGKFELAYCYFNEKQFNKAEVLFAAIKEQKEAKYYLAANYYYGLIAYNKNKYKEALQSFERVKDAAEYKAYVPYYIAEIYYFMGNRDKALLQALTLIKSREKSFYDKELHLLAAQCLFEAQKYKEAQPYFKFYYDHTEKIRKQDLYEMAYCDYKVGEWSEAIEKFRLLNSSADSLGQTSMYLLGDCYLKTNDKASARNAYGLCADLPYNKGQQEASMILYARISYEMGYHDDALRQLSALIKTFPSSQYKDEANTLISGLLIKTNNYDEALKYLQEVGRKEDDYWLVYQKANYGYAIEEFRKGDKASALRYFSQSLEHPVNTDYANAAYFWKGEIEYHQRRYNEAINYLGQFVSRVSGKKGVTYISPQATVQHAYLNMGYASMEMQNYQDAQDYFNKAQEQTGDTYSGMVALVREADAVFLQKNYPKAITLYDKIIADDGPDADYALYQKSILLGLTGKQSEKISLLQSLISKRPPSTYANFARYEIALAYLEADKYTHALTYLKALTDSISDKSFAPKAWMKRGFIYQQTDNISQAIEAYKQVVINYPASEDRFSALEALKGLYIQSNQPEAYSRLLKDNNLPSAESSSIDSTYYAAAETQYANGKVESARDAFTNYLKTYPNGIFAIKAHYYRGECNFRLKKYAEAKVDYNVILAGPWNEFYESSAKHAATIAYEEKNFALAFDYYQKLAANTTDNKVKELAYIGLIRSGYNSGKFKEVALYADSLAVMPGISEETANDALYYRARSIQRFDSTSDKAIDLYTKLSGNKNGDVAADSRFRIAEILYNQGKLKEAEEAANKAIKQSPGYDHWVAKSYLLLADILVKQKDYFNAKALLQSIVKHTKIAEVRQEATRKLEEVKRLEKKQSKLSEE